MGLGGDALSGPGRQDHPGLEHDSPKERMVRVCVRVPACVCVCDCVCVCACVCAYVLAGKPPQMTELEHLKRLEGADVRQGAPRPTPIAGTTRGPRGLGAFRGLPSAQGLTVSTARMARGRGLSSPPAKWASGRPGGEGAASAGALRRRVPESLIGRARPQPRSRGAGRRKRPCRMEIDLARRRLSRRCGSPGVWLLAPDCPFLVQVLQPSGFCALKIRV
uniref:Uncharacterized protein n=1 Tax=Rangifer tarandus platyrhynchus TaxID=3082113 RepID=A0ACB0FK52_RANTA|nr:unnamed protein product [Rangifer tarandus platyrhynchus]